MIDTLVAMEPQFRSMEVSKRFGFAAGEYLLVTLHRPALVDGALLPAVIDELSAIARELPVLFPVHPRTRARLADMQIGSGVTLTEPLSYLEFLSAQSDAAAILTDSGGVQEEATYLGVRCFTLRDNTERPVTVRLGTNTLLGLNPTRIADILPALELTQRLPNTTPSLWDGRAAQRVADVLERAFEQQSHAAVASSR
jgi:UDP-N-acetylglucosamine 2-epimerase (non-hydrolysing)